MLGKRFLVVDDDPVVRGSLQKYLEVNGCVVETAENGLEALTKLEQAEYDAMLLDYVMPVVNGLTVLRHVQRNYPSLAVMILTGERFSEVAVQSLLAMGARACLFKPFEPLELEQVIQGLGETSVQARQISPGNFSQPVDVGSVKLST